LDSKAFSDQDNNGFIYFYYVYSSAENDNDVDNDVDDVVAWIGSRRHQNNGNDYDVRRGQDGTAASDVRAVIS
jgi:hypothetical protein